MKTVMDTPQFDAALHKLDKPLKRVLLYNDQCSFTGHDAMALEVIKALLETDRYAITVVASEKNLKFIQSCEILSRRCPKRCIVLPIDFYTRPFQGLRNHYQKKNWLEVERTMRGLQPDVCLAVQNDIETSSLGVMIARRMGLPVISYLALPHSYAEKGVSLGYLRDWTNRYMYGMADRYWTVSEAMAKRLRFYNSGIKVDVLKNGIHLGQCLPYNALEARRQLNLPDQGRILGLIGRIDNQQKGHLFCLEMLQKYWEELAGYHWCIVGNGPDEHLVLNALQKSSWRDHFTWIPWMEPLGVVYSALDLLLMPSRYEGLPLVMLEALYQEVPVVATKCEAMKDFLPDTWLFKYGDKDGFYQAMMAALYHSQGIDRLTMRQKVQQEYSINTFKKEVVYTMDSYLFV